VRTNFSNRVEFTVRMYCPGYILQSLGDDMDKHLVITIDGPAGAGKSTVTKSLADRLHIHMLDTGALFRAYAWYVIEKGVSPANEQAVNDVLRDVRLDIQIEGSRQQTIVNGKDVSDLIRTPVVSQGASTIGTNAFVRRVLTEQVRRIAETTSLVADGRDVGTAMLPNATIKFYLTASPEERANRRFKELQSAGYPGTLDQVLEEIHARDHTDSTRAIAPLKCPKDAIVVDSTDKNAQQVLDLILKAIGDKQK
jgi:cytidylate kinase